MLAKLNRATNFFHRGIFIGDTVQLYAKYLQRCAHNPAHRRHNRTKQRDRPLNGKRNPPRGRFRIGEGKSLGHDFGKDQYNSRHQSGGDGNRGRGLAEQLHQQRRCQRPSQSVQEVIAE